MGDPTAPWLWTAATAAGLSYFGLEPAPLFWAFVGAVLGLSLAEPTSRLRGAVTFTAVAFVSSLLGSEFSQSWLHGSLGQRCVCACLLAAFYHPVYQKVASKVPDLVGRWIDRVFGAKP